jgi:hypothetical protein
MRAALLTRPRFTSVTLSSGGCFDLDLELREGEPRHADERHRGQVRSQRFGDRSVRCEQLVVVGGAPSGPDAVWPAQKSVRSLPEMLTACEKPKAFDHSQGLTSVRSMAHLLCCLVDRPPRACH